MEKKRRGLLSSEKTQSRRNRPFSFSLPEKLKGNGLGKKSRYDYKLWSLLYKGGMDRWNLRSNT